MRRKLKTANSKGGKDQMINEAIFSAPVLCPRSSPALKIRTAPVAQLDAWSACVFADNDEQRGRSQS